MNVPDNAKGVQTCNQPTEAAGLFRPSRGSRLYLVRAISVLISVSLARTDARCRAPRVLAGFSTNRGGGSLASLVSRTLNRS